MKTRDKIIQASIILFNKHGERNVTTNHIAAHLGISPGNLYYHFRNKEDIILSIYEEYASNLLLDTIPKVSNEVKPLDAIILYMDAVFQMMMKFRFFYSNLPVLLDKNPSLREKYVEVQHSIAERVSQLLMSLKDAGIVDFNDDDLTDIVSILRIINTFWLSFYQTQNMVNEINDSVFYQGVLKILVILKPYTTEAAMPELIKARDMYQQRCKDALVTL
ncbi:TetR/AcrR family transcriptional regulator [Colwellia sp. 4_MG-2023]|jgi:AcrR family transcriptional regulator|uniref:TetR/AcrR family transcriptional regulator n=1 Tax=unclassified Colwellia TaxID=196834 RepID=UPI001C09F01D|nr:MULTISPECIES: TetR/AcrR family transcriptional regulator [unclassified Colwellia]MBU2923693.1 TetR/AcrR family transcriptional regulator [Colwellia sp. C2M11]MDO6486276.1 TetR/AcrR family transcriptional regulator [Colwellia sp. 6_MG-2023]MDO6505784.1 TetR/AcrR family transcriptional regulator [Colwellia sp. 5_MG-2023]MDO6554465.1 TetR/AcrR family transcriptional regulator [Colwellia sp. 4_MG-2023]MDO6652207.1 TetR/AcrR family transcriptional regulator [Colwellia sp. 3_MG-2023]